MIEKFAYATATPESVEAIEPHAELLFMLGVGYRASELSTFATRSSIIKDNDADSDTTPTIQNFKYLPDQELKIPELKAVYRDHKTTLPTQWWSLNGVMDTGDHSDSFADVRPSLSDLKFNRDEGEDALWDYFSEDWREMAHPALSIELDLRRLYVEERPDFICLSVRQA